MPRPPALDDATLRAFEAHETRAHAVGDRVMTDLGDCCLLHTPSEREPYFNRIGAIRWPEPPAAFDRRLTEILAIFASIDRRPHVWTPPAFRAPADLEERLRANGFREAGTGARMMVLTEPVAPRRLEPGLSLERVTPADPRSRHATWIREVALVVTRAFGFTDDDLPAIERELRSGSGAPGMTTVVVRDRGEALAVGRSFVRDGMSYLLSIGTDPLAAGRGLGTLVTTTLAADAAAAGLRHVFLAVRTQNDRAIEVYRRCGFELVGDVAGELMLA